MTEKPKKQKEDAKAQARAFRKAAREAGVDPKVDIDEVVRRLAAQKKSESSPKKRG